MREKFPEVIEFLKTRRSVPAKTMTGPGPSDSELRTMIEIASRVPDHGKLAPWRFIRYAPAYCVRLNAICLARALERDPALSAEMREFEQTRFTRVPVVIAMASHVRDHPKVPHWEQLLSMGAAAMNLLIAANAQGYDAQWLTEWVAYDETLKPAFGIAADETLAGFMFVGTRTTPKTERERPAIEAIYSVMHG